MNGLILIHGWAKHRICSELLDRNESLRTDQQRKTQPANCNFLLPKHIIDMAQKILPLVLFYFALLHCLKAQLSGGSALSKSHLRGLTQNQVDTTTASAVNFNGVASPTSHKYLLETVDKVAQRYATNAPSCAGRSHSPR